MNLRGSKLRIKSPGPWRQFRRRLSRSVSRVDFYPRVEIATTVIAVVIGLISYIIVTSVRAPAAGLPPIVVTLLLVFNLTPLMLLITLIARRLALLVAHRRRGTAGARLHVRLVALFSVVAAVPSLLVVIFASLLFQFGVEFWFSDRAQTVLENADRVAQAYVQENKQRILNDLLAMGGDVSGYAREFGLESQSFAQGLAWQVAARNLSEAAVVVQSPKGLNMIAGANLDRRPLERRIRPQDVKAASTGSARVITDAGDRVEALIRLDPEAPVFLYVSRKVDPLVLAQVARTQTALSDYKSLVTRSRALELRFNIILLVVSLLILAVSIWIALWLANRLVRPIRKLVNAVERVGAGDMTARVPVRESPDEIGTLARAFNRMTMQLQAQTQQLINANDQLDNRRAFTEAVLAGVTAGILSVDPVGRIRLANRSAEIMLEVEAGSLNGQYLSEAAPELAEILDGDQSETIVQIARGSDTQTLAVKRVEVVGGYVLTFDDISQQLADQRRAAWADVARRIAHEIKNPLTPIQLSAERLQRKYGNQINDDPQTFSRLTGTIVRQVGDLRRMVDEFSSFARMPKPVFRAEPVIDIARQTLFLHEVAHPAISYRLTAPDVLPLLICDRRQVAQALTNLVKNATEAVEARRENDGAPGSVTVNISVDDSRLSISVVDDGIGLPRERDRITEPYMTTRARGTGLGLAIVKKIVEEHFGFLDFQDRPEGGSIVRIVFDMAVLAAEQERLSGNGDTIEGNLQNWRTDGA